MSNKIESFQPELGAGEASGAFTAEGQILTWHSSSPEKAGEQQSSLIPAVQQLIETARLAGLPSFEQILIEGPKKKILLIRVPKEGPFLFLMGGKSMDILPVFKKLKRAAEAVENTLKEPR